MALVQDTFQSKDVGATAASVLSPSATINVTSMSVANTTTSTVTVDVYITRSAVDYYIVKTMQLPAGMGYVFFGGDQKIVMENGDVLKVKSSSATSLDVWGSTAAL